MNFHERLAPIDSTPIDSTPVDSNDLTALLRRAALQDSRAFSKIHALTRNKLRKTAASVCAGSSDVDDVLQESYLKIWRHASAFDPDRASPISWMCVIVRNVAIDSVRSKKHLFIELDEETPEPVTDQEPDEFDYALAQRIAGEALSRLPADRRRLLSMAYFQGTSRRSLAEQFGVPVGTIKTWIRRSLASVQRDCLARGLA